MSASEFDTAVQAFMADPELTQLAEHLKVSGDMLDIVNLSETQHSDMLAWCLNPAEGHGQGDAVLKDFLIAAWATGKDCAWGTGAFFNEWTPSKIRVTSFGSAWVSREFSHASPDGKKGRLDLFIVDPQNRIVVTIENKAGAKVKRPQLEGYWQAVNAQIAKRPAFKDFHFAYVVLDQYHDEDALAEIGTKWAVLDYGWLAGAAQRAQHQVARDNGSAQLLMAYCQKLTEWANPAEQEVAGLAASLAIQHEAVVHRLREFRRLELSEWTPKMFSSAQGDLLYFYSQQERLCRELIETSGIASVRARVDSLARLPDDLVETGRTWMNLAPQSVEELMPLDADGGSWPVFLHVRRESRAVGASTFQIKLIWVKDSFAPWLDAQGVRALFDSKFKGLAKFDAFAVRRLVVARGLDAPAAAKKSIETLKSIEELAQQAVRAFPRPE